MADINLKSKIVLRNDLASAWTTANPVLLKGEIGIEIDTSKFKIGDGTKDWKTLKYAGTNTEDIKNYIDSYLLEDGKIKKELLPEGVGSAAVFEVTKTDLTTSDETAIKSKVTELKSSTTFKQGDIFIVTTKFDAAGGGGRSLTTFEMTGYIIASKPAANDEVNVWTACKALNGYVDADKVILKEDITLAGNYTQVGNITKSSAGATGSFKTKGKSVAAAFLEIFSKEIYPTTTNRNGSWSLSINGPTITNKQNITSGSIIKVNTSIEFNEVVAPAQSKNVSDKPKVSGFEYGYKDSMGGALQSAKEITVEWTANPKSGAKYTMSASKSGFTTTEITNDSAENATNTECKIGTNTLKADLGANSYTVNVTGPAHTGSAPEIPAKYIVSNLGKTAEDHKSTRLEPQSGDKNGATKATTFTVTAVYPIYHNSKSATNQATPDQEVVKDINSIEVEFGPSSTNKNQILYPKSIGGDADGHCTVEIWNALAQKYEAYVGSVSWSEENKDVNGTEYPYIKWVDGASYTEKSKYKFTFTKKTSQK